jgi:glycosyltransferase involved in cell wall biosynthesis
MRQKISVAIITLNNEKIIERCLDAVKWVDEIVVLDGYSTDRTIELCRKYTDKIYQKEFENFSIERDYVLKRTSNSWILSLDADMVCTKEFCDEVRNKLVDPKKDSYRHRVLTVFLGREIRHCSWYDYRFVRLFNKEKGHYNHERVIHDPIIMDNPGKTGKMKFPIMHYPEEDFITYFGKIKRYSFLTAHEYHRRNLRITPGNAAYYWLIKPWLIFFYKYIFKLGFLDGIPGIIVCFNSMISYYVAYASLWDMQRTGNYSIDTSNSAKYEATVLFNHFIS